MINPELQFDYKRYSAGKYNYDGLLRLYLDNLQPNFKQSLQSFVSSEDDLGPEIILNLKWLDAYRYQQKAVFYYLDLLQLMKERYSWNHLLANPTKEAFDESSGVKDPLFDVAIAVNFNDFKMEGFDPFHDYIRKAPYLFTILN